MDRRTALKSAVATVLGLCGVKPPMTTRERFVARCKELNIPIVTTAMRPAHRKRKLDLIAMRDALERGLMTARQLRDQA